MSRQTEYNRSAKGKAARARYAKTEKGKIALRKANLNWVAKNPEKRRAQNILNAALRDGKIKKKSCKVCGSTKSEAHHANYKKPLDVTWYCRLHHKRVHTKSTIKG